MRVGGHLRWCPGVVRVMDGLVRFAPNLGWTDVPLGDLLLERIGRAGVM